MGNETQKLADYENVKADSRKIHPIIMYPFSQPNENRHLDALYSGFVDRLSNDSRYCRPITVVNRQTYYRNTGNSRFDKLRKHIQKSTKIVDAWSVDSCQMWLSGFGAAYDEKSSVNDVYWLIPGDFGYATDEGQKVLTKLEDIPNMVWEGDAELCIGEIKVPLNSSKQLIDTYGTFGLLYNWFPAPAQGLRKITDKPRSEFFAINHDYLRKALITRRWYGYEQTIVILLQGMQGVNPSREIRKIELGEIEDDSSGRDTLADAMQQVERTERVLKLYWRELRVPEEPLWPEKFRVLDHQSEQIRNAAMVILQQILS